jgi:hypothetical protein
MYFSEDMKRWHLVCKYGIYCLYYYFVQMNLFESYFDYLQ